MRFGQMSGHAFEALDAGIVPARALLQLVIKAVSTGNGCVVVGGKVDVEHPFRQEIKPVGRLHLVPFSNEIFGVVLLHPPIMIGLLKKFKNGPNFVPL